MMHVWSFGLGQFPWKALLFWYFCLLLLDWGVKESGSVFSETQNLSPSPPLWAPLCAPISCHMFFPIFLHIFSHSTSETLLCVLVWLSVICWSYFCLYILLSVVWPELGRKEWHLDMNWLICVKLGSWSCQLWYRHPLWVLTPLTKRDSGFIALTSIISKCVSSYLPSPSVIAHFLVSPSTVSHLQLLFVSSSIRGIPHQLHLISHSTSGNHWIFLFCLLPPMLYLILTCLC